MSDPTADVLRGVLQRVDALHARLRALEEALERKLNENLAIVMGTLERIDASASRNADVAQKYGDRADSLFSVVDFVANVMKRANPLTYLPSRPALDDE
jgi:hypothetical protein